MTSVNKSFDAFIHNILRKSVLELIYCLVTASCNINASRERKKNIQLFIYLLFEANIERTKKTRNKLKQTYI